MILISVLRCRIVFHITFQPFYARYGSIGFIFTFHIRTSNDDVSTIAPSFRQSNSEFSHSVYSYCIDDNQLRTIHHPFETEDASPAFRELAFGFQEQHLRHEFKHAEMCLRRIEIRVHRILTDVLRQGDGDAATAKVPVSDDDYWILSKYFIFLQFRNGSEYLDLINALENNELRDTHTNLSKLVGIIALQRCKSALTAVARFLNLPIPKHEERPSASWHTTEPYLRDVLDCCLERCHDLDICIGIPSEGQEFILPGQCFGILDEAFGCGEPEDMLVPALRYTLLG
jgi:hypothetical protein